MTIAYSHEEFSEKVDTAFAVALDAFVPGVTTEKQLESIIYNYLVENFRLNETDSFFININIDNITYLDVSDLLDRLTNVLMLEKCCRYDENNSIFVSVLILREQLYEEQ